MPPLRAASADEGCGSTRAPTQPHRETKRDATSQRAHGAVVLPTSLSAPRRVEQAAFVWDRCALSRHCSRDAPHAFPRARRRHGRARRRSQNAEIVRVRGRRRPDAGCERAGAEARAQAGAGEGALRRPEPGACVRRSTFRPKRTTARASCTPVPGTRAAARMSAPARAQPWPLRATRCVRAAAHRCSSATELCGDQVDYKTVLMPAPVLWMTGMTSILGRDFSGVVVRTSSPDFAVGDRVYGNTPASRSTQWRTRAPSRSCPRRRRTRTPRRCRWRG